MSRNQTIYYVFEEILGKPVICKTLQKAMRIVRTFKYGTIDKVKYTPSKSDVMTWFPRKDRIAPSLTFAKLYRKILKKQYMENKK